MHPFNRFPLGFRAPFCALFAATIGVTFFCPFQPADAAQVDVFSRPVDLHVAYEFALQKTETLPLQKSSQAQSEARIDQATGSIFPTVAVLGAYTRQDNRAATATGTTNAFTQPDQWSARLNLQQPIFRGLGEWAEIRARRARSEAQSAQTRAARLTIYATVASSFYDVLAAESDLSTLRALAELTDKRLTELRERTEIGRSRRGELLSAESQEAALQAQIAAAETAVRQAREALRFSTGLPETTPLRPESKELPNGPPELAEYEEKIEARPDVEAARLELSAAEETVGVTRSVHFPTIDFVANYYLARTGILQNTKWDIGVNLAIPLFQGGVPSATTDEAIELRKSSELRLAQVRRSALRDIRARHSALVYAIAQLKALKRSVKLSEESYAEQTKDYRLGLVSNLDVIQALNAFQESKRQWERTRYQAYAALAALRAASGTIP